MIIILNFDKYTFKVMIINYLNDFNCYFYKEKIV